MKINLKLNSQNRRESTRAYFEELAKNHCTETFDRTSLVMDFGGVGILTCTWDGHNFGFIWADKTRKINYKDID